MRRLIEACQNSGAWTKRSLQRRLPFAPLSKSNRQKAFSGVALLANTVRCMLPVWWSCVQCTGRLLKALRFRTPLSAFINTQAEATRFANSTRNLKLKMQVRPTVQLLQLQSYRGMKHEHFHGYSSTVVHCTVHPSLRNCTCASGLLASSSRPK